MTSFISLKAFWHFSVQTQLTFIFSNRLSDPFTLSIFGIYTENAWSIVTFSSGLAYISYCCGPWWVLPASSFIDYLTLQFYFRIFLLSVLVCIHSWLLSSLCVLRIVPETNSLLKCHQDMWGQWQFRLTLQQLFVGIWQVSLLFQMVVVWTRTLHGVCWLLVNVCNLPLTEFEGMTPRGRTLRFFLNLV